MKNNDIKFKDFNLSNEIKRGLSELGFKNPLEVQKIVIPKILEEDRDLIVESQTGSGKTASFGIPICEKIDPELPAVQMLVLTPTRELAEQIKYDIEGIGKHRDIKCSAVYGKQPIEMQIRDLKKKPQVIAATPGRLIDHLKRKNIRLNDLKYLVIDEADEMLIMGFEEQIDTIISKIHNDRTTLLFSATMPEKVVTMSEKYLFNPEKITVESNDNVLERIEQIHYKIDPLQRVDFLRKMLVRERPKKAIIFCNTQEQVERLFDIMKKKSQMITKVHGGMTQRARMEKLTGFKKGQYNILIATDVAARGIHVDDVTHVINFFVPFSNENYVHRIGRTGRVGKEGIAITLVSEKEQDIFDELEKYLEYKIPCLGGHVEPKMSKKKKLHPDKKTRYKAGNQKGATIQLNFGRMNSKLTKRDLMNAISKIGGVSRANIGKVDVKDKITRIQILDGKEKLVKKGLENTKIKGRAYRGKIK